MWQKLAHEVLYGSLPLEGDSTAWWSIYGIERQRRGRISTGCPAGLPCLPTREEEGEPAGLRKAFVFWFWEILQKCALFKSNIFRWSTFVESWSQRSNILVDISCESVLDDWTNVPNVMTFALDGSIGLNWLNWTANWRNFFEQQWHLAAREQGAGGGNPTSYWCRFKTAHWGIRGALNAPTNVTNLFHPKLSLV